MMSESNVLVQVIDDGKRRFDWMFEGLSFGLILYESYGRVWMQKVSSSVINTSCENRL